MQDSNSHDQESELDRATSARLGKLRALSVDTSRLDRMIQSQIPRAENRKALSWIWLRPVRAIAASLTLVAVIGAILLSSSGGPVLASATQMAQVHEDMVDGRTPAERVESIDEANKALAAQWPQAPQLPGMPAGTDATPPESHVMACCMKSVKNKKMACVLLQNSGVPITMTVANASDMQLPDSPTALRNGVTYHLQAVGQLNMVMSERSSRWVCLIGQVPADQLMDLAAKLQF